MSDQPNGPITSSGTASLPSRATIDGHYTSRMPLEPSHAGSSWKHLGEDLSKTNDPFCYTVLSGPRDDPKSEPVGQMSYLNIVPSHRRIEIGSIIFGEQLKQTRAATEAFYLIIKHAFEDLGYLRVEWKANHLNKSSLAAAERLGFVFEGIFRKHMIFKGRRRDTAWLSITDDDWPLVKKAFELWLSEDNFDKDGKQIKSLKDIRQVFAKEQN
ncbi:acyl-CoA N-acyltransferase [Lipomyces japonicus]|uniref:acyl-CoA N-acyltransferase n=1 Tax=Lipomyces japonicus TaxID=56871 RepID=UPI0034CD5F4E